MSRVNLKAYSGILNTVKVSIFHRQPVVRVGFSTWLEQAGIFRSSVKATATELLDSCDDEILLLDVASIQGLDTNSFNRLKRHWATKTIVVATRDQLNRLGWRIPENIGSLIPPCGAFDDFVQAILSVTHQSTYVAPGLLAAWNRVLVEPSFELTNRQLQVLRLVASGKTSVQIAGLLGLSPKTVENHRAAIKDRMGVVCAAEMVNKAHKRGIC